MMYALQISTFGEPSDVVERVEIPDPGAPTGQRGAGRRGIRADQPL